MGPRTATTSAASLVLAALVCVPASAQPAATADPVRILVVGDSISQGSAGDWTWRYRLWQHLTGHGVSVDFVGPRDDLYDNVAGTFGSQAYLDPAFDRDHASRWGMRLAALDLPIATLMSTYHPDVVVEMLGDNDLGEGKTPDQVRDLLHDLVDDARAVTPGVEVVLGQIPRPTTQQNAGALNTRITQLAADLDSSGSRVVATDVAGYDDLQDTWDGAHPNARGELKIAAQVENALHEVAAGFPAAGPIPTVPLGPRIPPVASPTASTFGAGVTWVRSPGSQESEVWARDVTAGESWHRVAQHVTGLGYTVTGLPAWHRVQLQTKPLKGYFISQSDAWSNIVETEVLGDHLDPVATPTASATADGRVSVGWPAVPHAAAYAVQWRRADEPGAWLAAPEVPSTSFALGGLGGRPTYAFRVRALRSGVPTGAFSDEATVRVPALGPVGGVRVVRTKRGIRTTAEPVAFAVTYTLRVAAAARCRHVPRDRRFTVAATGLTSASKRLRIDARAVWVRWVAVRDGTEGDIARSSTACTRQRRTGPTV